MNVSSMIKSSLVMAVAALSALGANGAMAISGADIYKNSCAACHGPTGNGDGPAVGTLSTKPQPFKGTATRLSIEKAVIVRTSDRPGHGVAPLFTPIEVNDLINYVEALSK
jgi:mono/diheme cytochrome c family protein